MLKILFIPDIVAKIGRETVAKILPKIKNDLKPNLIIANADNITHGKGASPDSLKDLMSAGINYFTNGDHAFDKISHLENIYKGNYPILRPANYPEKVIGEGFALIPVDKKGKEQVLLINLIGRVFMKYDYECPFEKIDKILANFANHKLSAIIVDIHAEATSEKISIRHFVDGRVSALVGTHTHVMTADQQVTKKGTAFITDVGMVGSYEGVIGMDKENILKTFLTQINYPHVTLEKGNSIFNAVLININTKTKKAVSIKPIIKFINIK